MRREEKKDDSRGFWERLLCCICDAVEAATDGEFPQSKPSYQPPKKQPSDAKKPEESQGTKASDDHPPPAIGTLNMTLSISIPKKQLESTTSLKASIITDKGEDEQAKPPATKESPDGRTKQNGTQPTAAKENQRQESQHKQDGGQPQGNN
ncbi:uncharacterized protein LOC135628772 [Musa acuminata AAA Group]|uniref:uncharacterized protein LOC135628772 n=1 Tax=Musa acuminata AAA Group TaxID=214697 RepID=UPI0031CE8989